MQVGFIGLGQMGAAMATNLVAAGHTVTVYNRSPAKAAPLVDTGARLAASPADACQGDVVVTMLADDRAVGDLAFADGGVVASLSPGALHVSMSTISVELSERLNAAHVTKG
jgi:3-hydroxyisobutyrate dehydrogenase-like beta-hydroxyacid dehydrogenase